MPTRVFTGRLSSKDGFVRRCILTKSKTYTVAELKALPPGKHCDGEGLWFLKTETGKARWFFRYTLYGRQRETGLGKFPLISLSEARSKAEELRKIVANGEDPVRLKRRQRELVASTDGRFDVLAEKAYSLHRQTMKTGDPDRKWFSPVKNKLLPRLGKMPVMKIDQHDIYDALAKSWHVTPAACADSLSRLRTIFKFAIASGFDVDLTIIEKTRILLGTRIAPVQHHEAMHWRDAPAFYQSLCDTHPTELALRMLLLTGVRSGAVRNMRFEQIEGDVWTIPVENVKGKTEYVRPFAVPLGTEALAVIELAKAVSMNGFLFPNARGGSLDKMAMRNFLTERKIDGRPHGFRTTIRTWIADHEVCSREVAEAVLGHFTGNKVEKAYNRTDYLDLRRPVMARYEAFLTGKI